MADSIAGFTTDVPFAPIYVPCVVDHRQLLGPSSLSVQAHGCSLSQLSRGELRQVADPRTSTNERNAPCWRVVSNALFALAGPPLEIIKQQWRTRGHLAATERRPDLLCGAPHTVARNVTACSSRSSKRGSWLRNDAPVGPPVHTHIHLSVVSRPQSTALNVA